MFIPLLVIEIIFYNNEYKDKNDMGSFNSASFLDGYFIGIISVIFVLNIVKIFSYSG